jgi:hypothetical protein
MQPHNNEAALQSMYDVVYIGAAAPAVSRCDYPELRTVNFLSTLWKQSCKEKINIYKIIVFLISIIN